MMLTRACVGTTSGGEAGSMSTAMSHEERWVGSIAAALQLLTYC